MVGEWLLHIGFVVMLTGFLSRDQILLRALLVLGVALLMAHFLLQAEPAIWTAGWLAVLIVINIVMVWRLYTEQGQLVQSEDERDLFQQLDGLSPAEFSRLMKITDWVHVADETVLTAKDEPVDALFFILHGKVLVERSGKHIVLGQNSFVGELGILLGQNATATVTATAGATLARWEAKRYRRFMARNPQTKIVFDAILNRDMANKLRS